MNQQKPAVTSSNSGLISFIVVIIAAGGVGGALYVLSQNTKPEVPIAKTDPKGPNGLPVYKSNPGYGVPAGGKAPALAAGGWINSDGAPDTTGKYVLVDCWAPWCAPCLNAIPKLKQVHEKYGDKIMVIGLTSEPNPNRSSRGGPSTNDIIKMKKLDWPNGYAAVTTLRGLKASSIPCYYIVDPSGKIVWEGQTKGPYYHNLDLGVQWVLEQIAKKENDDGAEVPTPK